MIKITPNMIRAYNACLIHDLHVKNDDNRVCYMRICSDSEAENIADKNCNCGSDGAFYKKAQHTNDFLQAGQKYLFSAKISSLRSVVKAYVCLQELKYSQDREYNLGDKTRSIAVFSVDPETAIQYKQKGVYGFTWGDFILPEIHLPVTEEHMQQLNIKGVVPDVQTYLDCLYGSNDVMEILDRQKRTCLDKKDPLHMQRMFRYIERNPKYSEALKLVEEMTERYNQDLKEQDKDEALYDEEDDVEDEKQSSGMSIVDFDRNTNEELLIETIESTLYNSGYSAATKKETLAEYIRTLPEGPAIAQLLETKYHYSIPGLTDAYITAEIKVEDEVNIFDSQSSSTTESTQDTTTTSTSEQNQGPEQ